MRILLLFFPVLLLSFGIHAQSWSNDEDGPPGLFYSEATIGLLHSTGQGMMENTVGSGYGFAAELFFFLGESNFSLGLDAGFSVYEDRSFQDLYYFDNGELGVVDVNIWNSFSTVGLNTRYHLARNRVINPYVFSRLGSTRFMSNLDIEDPRLSHTQYCPVPLVSEMVLSSRTLTFSYGAGVQFDVGKIFSGRPSGVLFDIRAQMLRGGPTRHMSFEEPASFANFESDLFIGFASEIEPELVHDYHVGYIYNSPLRMIDTRFQLTFRF